MRKGSSVAGDPDDRRCGAVRAEWRVRGDVRASGPPLDRTGKAAASPATCRRSIRCAPSVSTDGAAGVSICCSALVCRARYRRSGLGPFCVSRRTGSGFWKRRLLRGSLTSILNQGEIRKLLSDEHFSVDGTRVEAWASLKSFKPKRQARMATSFSGIIGTATKRSTSAARSGATQTHASRPPIRTLGSIARDRLGMEAKLSFIGHALMENRNGPFSRGTADQCIGSCRETGRARYDRALCRQSHFDHAGRTTRASMPLTSSWSFAKST